MDRESESENQSGTSSALLARQKFSLLFKTTREEKGFALRDIVHLTRISQPFVEAIEQANFEDLPGHVFVKGFIRSICQTLSVDPKDLIAAFDQCLIADGKEQISIKRKKSLTTIPQKNKKIRDYALFRFLSSIDRRKAFKWLAVPVVFIFAGGAAWFLKQAIDSRFSEPTVTVSAAPEVAAAVQELPAAPVPAAEEAPAAIPAPENQAPEQITLQPKAPESSAPTQQSVLVKVLRSAEIKIAIDAKEPTTKLYEPGEYHFNFDKRADFYLFDTEALDIQYNNQKLSNLSSFGKTRKLSFVAPSEQSQQQKKL